MQLQINYDYEYYNFRSCDVEIYRKRKKKLRYIVKIYVDICCYYIITCCNTEKKTIDIHLLWTSAKYRGLDNLRVFRITVWAYFIFTTIIAFCYDVFIVI
eukprot:535849_1